MAEAIATAPILRDVEDFLAWAETRPERWQFVEGRLVMMAGASDPHDFLTVNTIALLREKLRGTPCRPHGPDRGVRIGRRNFYLPDASVSCRRADGSFASEPVLVVEVLSPATERDDRGVKWRNYQTLASLRHYLLLSQDEPLAELFTRGEEGWIYTRHEGLEATVPLAAMGIELPLSELYADIVFPQPEEGEDEAGPPAAAI
ncbi:MAG: Uma2 family endonuclease [Geminicoccaceae bacterium]|nr:Uma2 family endonuclease [Geminicoccaceae bacterium]MCX8101586.1 Uma2 family endonuclease [Geminicoccaceae bacterium]MDW8369867.1 Uma2 family endonuclease [Geminicoccaceae bacterium]